MVSLDDIPELTFDHADIIRYALDKLRHRTQHSTRRRPVGSCLPQFFTLSELQQFFEVVLNRSYDKGISEKSFMRCLTW